MTLRLPGERSLNMLAVDIDRDAALRACLHHGPRRIYGGLLHHARQQGWKDGWAYHAFKEIFGAPPRRQDQSPPASPPLELKAWISLRPKRSKSR
jgi:hypothetical protein